MHTMQSSLKLGNEGVAIRGSTLNHEKNNDVNVVPELIYREKLYLRDFFHIAITTLIVS